jgi:NCAIR mutase (PurE)-related protein
MENGEIISILKAVKAGRLSVEDAVERLSSTYESLGFATIDTGRKLRTGVCEVIFCQGKTREQVAKIAVALHKRSKRLLATRADPETFEAIKQTIPEAVYNETARVVTVNPHRKRTRKRIAVISAGTSDIPVAEEAAATAEFLGNPVDRVYDVGVAGIHRLFGRLGKLKRESSSAPMCWSWWPEWKGPWRAWWEASLAVPSSGFPQAWAMAQASAAWPRCLPCSTHARRA